MEILHYVAHHEKYLLAVASFTSRRLCQLICMKMAPGCIQIPLETVCTSVTHALRSLLIAPGDLKMWHLSVLLRVRDGIRLQVEDKSFSFYRCFIQPNIFFMEMPDWQQTIKQHSSVIFKAMLIWGVELFGAYRTVVFVREVLALRIYLPLSVRAHNNKRRMSLKRETAGFCLLVFPSLTLTEVERGSFLWFLGSIKVFLSFCPQPTCTFYPPFFVRPPSHLIQIILIILQ